MLSSVIQGQTALGSRDSREPIGRAGTAGLALPQKILTGKY